MADNIENHYHQRPQRTESSANGWILGAVVAVLAILALWYYGTHRDVTMTGAPSNVTTTAPAPAPETQPAAPTPVTPPPAAPATGTGDSTTGGTAPAAPAPAPAPAPANP